MKIIIKSLIVLTCLLASFLVNAQVKIGDNPTNVGVSSSLELESTNKALLITRVANTAAITSPVNGMIIYDISSNCFKGYQNGAWTECGFVNANSSSGSILAQIGNEGDSPNTVPSVVTAAQLTSLGVTGVTSTNESAYQAYIDANPNSFSSPATIAEVQAMITAVNNAVTSVLAQIGNEGDSPNTVPSVVTTAQLTSLGVTGVTSANQAAYQAYIDANPNSFSSPATIAEVQAMITAVNNSGSNVLVQIGNEGDSPNTVPSVVTTAQLTSLGVTGVTSANEAAYQTYIDANPNSFSSPATIAEVQAMITAVNNAVTSVLAQIGNEGDSPNTVPSVVTTTQLTSLGVTGVVTANEAAYQAYIDANPNSFSSPATIAEVQAMITAVNNSINAVLTQIGNEGDSPNTVPSVVTTTQLTSLGVTGVVTANEAAYQAYIDANPNSFSSPATIAEVQAMITAVNNSINAVLTQIGNEGDSPNTVPSVVTTAQLTSLGVTGVVTANEAAYQAYIDANPNSFSSPATIAEVQAAVTAVNAILTQIGNEGDSPNTVPSAVTTAQLTSLGVTGVVTANQAAYQSYIDANPSLFSSPATLAEVQAAVTAVNVILTQIGNEGDSPNTVPSVVTTTQLSSLGVTSVKTTNEAAYQAYIDANPSLFSSPATLAEVQAAVTAVNTSNGTAVVSSYTCNTASSGGLVQNQSASSTGATQTITANVTTPGTYNISATALGITFAATGTFTSTGPQTVVLTATGTTTTWSFNYPWPLNTTPTCSFNRQIGQANSGGTSSIMSVTCATASAGTLTQYVAASGVTQTITLNVINTGSYYIAATAAGVTFAGSGTFTSTGTQNVVLTATGTPTTSGATNFTLMLASGNNCTFSRTINAGTTITLAQNYSHFVFSLYDQDYLPYTAPTGVATTNTQAANGVNEAVTVNVQGSITTTGVSIKIPVTVTGTGSGTLAAYSTTITIPASMTSDGISRNVTLSWAAQGYTSTTKSINATIAAVGGTLNAIKLDINAGIGNDALGVLMGQFTYPYNFSGNTTNLNLRIIAGIPDRMFGLAQNSTDNLTNTHLMLYLPTMAEDGNIWLNNNLGADYANMNKGSFNPASQATSATDYSAYGSLFQWGRKADGHELITWSGGTTGSPVSSTSPNLNDTPTDANFITPSNSPFNWRNSSDTDLWATEASTNNPCPVGFRVPTQTELTTLVTAATITNAATAASSNLKFTDPGYRSSTNGTLTNVGSDGRYWSSTASTSTGSFRVFQSSGTFAVTNNRSTGFSVRCIKN